MTHLKNSRVLSLCCCAVAALAMAQPGLAMTDQAVAPEPGLLLALGVDTRIQRRHDMVDNTEDRLDDKQDFREERRDCTGEGADCRAENRQDKRQDAVERTEDRIDDRQGRRWD
jgi:hypothetical protein